MLYRYIFTYYQSFYRNRHARRKLLCISIACIFVAILRHVAFIFRRNYVRSYDVDAWFTSRTGACNDFFNGYGHQFVKLEFASVDTKKETFSIYCNEQIPRYWFYKGYQGTPLESWIKNIVTTRITSAETKILFRNPKVINRYLFVVKRNEAHNPYHTFCEFYNIFLVANHFGWKPKESIEIVFMDSRPATQLDEMWRTLFLNVFRKDEVSPNDVYRNVVWMPIGYESPMNFHLVKTIPHVEEFRMLVLKSFGVQPRIMDCQRLNVVLVLRHDYISHPERLELFGGKIHRKFANEPDIIWALEKAFPGKHNVKAVVLEDMSFKDQIGLMSSTDILIGMHGAGLSHIMFLPESAVVLELFPNSYKWRAAYYFHAMAIWRRLKYIGWTNPSSEDEIEKGFSSKIPPEYISKTMTEIKTHFNGYLCADVPIA